MNKKTAFTLAEVLVTMAIIGIVVTFGLKAALQNDKAIRHLYANTYHALDKALYNGYNFPTATSHGDPFVDKDPNGYVPVGRAAGNGSSISSDEGTERLCYMLTEYINTTRNNPCQGSRTRLMSDNPQDADFTDARVQFIASNGVKIYISRRMPYKGAGPIPYRAGQDTTFYIIYADINGAKFPNSMNYRTEKRAAGKGKTVDPDIFAFAALDFGRVVPLGVPEFDGRYMLSRIAYFDPEQSSDDDRMNTLYSRPSQPYYLMKAQAWGYYNTVDRLADDAIIDKNPYSFNGYIKARINPNSRIYPAEILQKYFRNGKVITVPTSANIKSKDIAHGGYNCVKQSDENCDVIVDNYLY